MSGVIIAGDTSGSVTLQAPAVAGTTTLTLPATSGTIITGAGGVTAVVNGGTGLATLTANNVMLGNGTSTPSFVAPGTNGNILTSNGITWTSAAATVGLGGVSIFTTSGTFTIPTGVTKVKVTVIGGGAGTGGGCGDSAGVGGFAMAFCTGVSGTLTITVGAGGAGGAFVGSPGGTSSITGTGVSVSATGGQYLQSNPGAASGAGTVTTGTAMRAAPANTYYDNADYPTVGYFTGGSRPAAGSAAKVYSSTGSNGAGFGAIIYSNEVGGVGGVIIIEY